VTKVLGDSSIKACGTTKGLSLKKLPSGMSLSLPNISATPSIPRLVESFELKVPNAVAPSVNLLVDAILSVFGVFDVELCTKLKAEISAKISLQEPSVNSVLAALVEIQKPDLNGLSMAIKLGFSVDLSVSVIVGKLGGLPAITGFKLSAPALDSVQAAIKLAFKLSSLPDAVVDMTRLCWDWQVSGYKLGVPVPAGFDLKLSTPKLPNGLPLLYGDCVAEGLDRQWLFKEGGAVPSLHDLVHFGIDNSKI
jgi:hypothetical protein